MKERKKDVNSAKDIQLNYGSTIKTILYADDQDLANNSEEELQMAAHQLYNVAKKYNLKISTSKTKYVAMCSNVSQRLKMVIEGKVTEQVTELKFLGNKVSKYKKDMKYKFQTYNRIN
jgi:hypothetical protein